jgi:hypothetical protein
METRAQPSIAMTDPAELQRFASGGSLVQGLSFRRWKSRALFKAGKATRIFPNNTVKKEKLHVQIAEQAAPERSNFRSRGEP